MTGPGVIRALAVPVLGEAVGATWAAPWKITIQKQEVWLFAVGLD